MHPPSTGSHIPTIFGITKEMVKRGHHVTTVRYEMIQGIKLPCLENHTEIVLSINNTDGNMPYITKVSLKSWSAARFAVCFNGIVILVITSIVILTFSSLLNYRVIHLL